MAVTNQTAWLERTWLDTTWLGADIEDSTNAQVELKIVDSIDSQNAQTELQIDVLDSNHVQVERRIETENSINSQVQRDLDTQDVINSQVELQIVDVVSENFVQATATIDVLNNIRCQVERVITDAIKQNGAQVELKIDNLKLSGAQVYSSNIYYVICEGWLESSWLTKSWLSRHICGHSRTQLELKINTISSVGSQVELFIEDREYGINSQVEMQIDVEIPIGSQVNRQFALGVPSQVLIALYNTTRPRIMCQFPSRGTTGQNWTATNTMPGDFSILNVNNDVSEFYYRTSNGVTTVNLVCDTEVPQGIFMDTLYMEGHNLSRSAVVVMEFSNDSAFTTIGKSINLAVSTEKIFYVEPTLPTVSYRYHRFRISDPFNADGHIKIGLIIFGSSNIFNSECATQDIMIAARDYTNAMPTEGFTSVANSRSLKRAVRLNFRNLSYDSGDYETLNDVINYSRTTLKCLWIPDPRSRSLMERFAVFGKLTKIPEQRHNVKGHNDNMDFIDLTVEIDEAK